MSVRRGIPALAFLGLGASLLAAADFSTYRGFTLGAPLALAAQNAGARPADIRVLHQRPALLQEFEWRRGRPLPSADPAGTDPVSGAVLSFLDGKLYRIVVPYDTYRTEGMSPEDFIEALSRTYGLAARPLAEIPLRSIYAESAKVIARWQDAAYACDLVRTGDLRGFALVIYSKPLESQAQAAFLEAARLDLKDAPRLALLEEKKREEELRLAAEKSRARNRPNFRP